jgi:hypothetical protein
MSQSICRLCTRKVDVGSDYCVSHYRAYSQLQKKYPEWKSAYENISWERYLETIMELKEIGDLAKALAAEELRRSKAR